MKLHEKVAVITGGGSGIGQSTSRLFADEGAQVVIVDIDEEAGSHTAGQINENGGRAFFFSADVTNEESIISTVSLIIQKLGKIDILFNNAGISGVGPLHEVKTENWDKIFAVNVKGVFLTSKHVIPSMIENRSGSIINMSSCIAEMGLADRAAYAATKGAILSLTKSMQVDYASHHIRVNALLPGTIFTPFVEKYLKESYENPEEAIEKIKKRQLSEELGSPEDVARAALFLASDDSQFVMGSPFYVDGGVVFGKNV
ncbi:SDR family NAD(P)-dependent oxidoreductase [Alteribacillus sp. HJP-4]|uniref:SDR family NAD(P)-dependent oxidoreductase n=1 Tax=Alteribacillus sp. HJP-4 TaxID=2775394 RepID=UPI0035CCCFDC